eukprot:TRINITY_DN9623_c0_g1_i1.p1 TRINITY_DN9623_c0_g1~~TRINITY_DN9623_c0_g1_i1.p1  ORF type:complete len:536 (+),score=159.77 TRINITY_DN9623_c0_g1_i1:84-1610(+)
MAAPAPEAAEAPPQVAGPSAPARPSAADSAQQGNRAVQHTQPQPPPPAPESSAKRSPVARAAPSPSGTPAPASGTPMQRAAAAPKQLDGAVIGSGAGAVSPAFPATAAPPSGSPAGSRLGGRKLSVKSGNPQSPPRAQSVGPRGGTRSPGSAPQPGQKPETEVERGATSVLFELSEEESGRQAGAASAPPRVQGHHSKRRRRRRGQPSPQQERQLPPLAEAPTPAPDTVKVRAMRRIGRAPPLLKRALMAQMARLERARPSPEAEWWAKRQGRTADPQSGVYVLPKPREAPNVESCIVRQLPSTLAGGDPPQSFLNLIGFARQGIVQRDMLSSPDVAESVQQNPQVFAAVLPGGTPERAQPDPAPASAQLKQLEDEARLVMATPVTDMVEQGRQSPLPAKARGLRALRRVPPAPPPAAPGGEPAASSRQAVSPPPPPYEMCTQSFFGAGCVSLGGRLGRDPPPSVLVEASRYRVPAFHAAPRSLAAPRPPLFELPDPIEHCPYAGLQY